jgi:hypothetical protein
VQRAIAIISKSIDQWEKQLLSEKNHWYTMLTVKCVGWTLAGDIMVGLFNNNLILTRH